MKRTIVILSGLLATATILYAQQRYRREHLICPTDGAQMNWTGIQQGGLNPSCEFSHVAIVDGKRVIHKAWASCSEIR